MSRSSRLVLFMHDGPTPYRMLVVIGDVVEAWADIDADKLANLGQAIDTELLRACADPTPGVRFEFERETAKVVDRARWGADPRLFNAED